jgi:hypothetical protein
MQLGDRALNRLAVLHSEDWPMLAAQRLAEGYDSPALRDFAALTPAEAAVLADLMADVLRSLGVDLPATENFAANVFEISGFAHRCRTAMRVVQRDLDRTGHRDLQMHPVKLTQDGRRPGVYAALPDDRAPASSGEPMTADLDDADLVGVTADAVCETLLIVAGIRWPRCTLHPNRYMIAGPDPQAASGREDLRYWWWCNAADKHPLTPIGELTTSA